jgi:hypothetical protein
MDTASASTLLRCSHAMTVSLAERRTGPVSESQAILDALRF